MDLAQREFCNVLDDMTLSFSSVRELVQSLREKQRSSDELETKDGISLLSLKHHLLLSYLQFITLVTAHRAIGHTLNERTPPAGSFSSTERGSRGAGAGDRVDAMIEGRVVLEKIKVLEGRMKYQIEKLVRLAEEKPGADTDQAIVDDPLSFRPNPENLLNTNTIKSDRKRDVDFDPSHLSDHDEDEDGIYHPPRLAATPYIESSKKSRRERKAPPPTALASLIHSDPSRPFVESSTGLGSTPALASSRAREIQRMTEFEEDNFTRIMMKKKDAKRRARDEEDIALGGSGATSGRRRGGPAGLADEFGDVFKSVSKSSRVGIGAGGDGYEELRKKGKKVGLLERSRDRIRSREDAFGGEDGPQRAGKRGRFEEESKRMNKANKKKVAKLKR